MTPPGEPYDWPNRSALSRALPVRPMVCARYHAEVVAGDAVAFVGENGTALIRDPVAQHVVPLIDGHRSSDEIAKSLAPGVARRQVDDTLADLTHAGLVVESAGLATSISMLWAEIGVSEFRAREVLAALTVAIETLVDDTLAGLHDAISAFGFAVADDPDESDIKVVVVDDYLDPRLTDVDTRAEASGQRWLLVKPSGVNVWAGPGFVPGQSACWHCLAEQLRRNRPVDDYLHRHDGPRVPIPSRRGRSHVARSHAYSMAATQLARWVGCATDQPPVESTLVVLETLRLTPSWHCVLRRPQCASCGERTLAVPLRASGPS